MLTYLKMNGNGNNFLVMDNRAMEYKTEDISKLCIKDCNVCTSIGADGILLVEPSDIADFRYRIFNSDGTEGEMCGNGAKCIAQYAYDKKIAPRNMTFETLSGIVEGEILDGEVRIRIGNVDMEKLQVNQKINCNGREVIYNYLPVGVTHCVVYTEENNITTKEEMFAIGRAMDEHRDVFPRGSNINFAKVLDDHSIEVITYERGVEDFTDSCGTGSGSCALVTACLHGMKSPVLTKNMGGDNTVSFKFSEDGKTCVVYLQGPVKYAAEIHMLS